MAGISLTFLTELGAACSVAVFADVAGKRAVAGAGETDVTYGLLDSCADIDCVKKARSSSHSSHNKYTE